MYKIAFLLLFFLWLNSARALPLAQRIHPGITFHHAQNGICIDSIQQTSFLFPAGIRKGDVITQVNNNPLAQKADYENYFLSLRAGDSIHLSVLRSNKILSIKTVVEGKPLPEWPGIEIEYGEVQIQACTLRSILYLPKDQKKHPGILLIPGYNCGSIENFPLNYHRPLISSWVKQGFAVYTLEKSGVGDSKNCLLCTEVDLQTDITGYQAGLSAFKKHQRIDSQAVFIWGHSMGGIIAPVLAYQQNIKGIMVFGTVFRPWRQFLLDMHRVQKPLLEQYTETQTDQFLDTIQDIYHHFFVSKKSPAQLFQTPTFKPLVSSELEYKPESNQMWGRHWRFWQQIDSLDLDYFWRKVACKVLVLHGGADYIQCSALEPYLIETAVNTSHPGNAKWITIPDLDHLCMQSKNYEEAVRNFNNKQYLKGNFNPKLLEVTSDWLKEVYP